MPPRRSLFASRATAQILITVSFSETVNDRGLLFQIFLATAARDEVQDLTVHYPQRWHVEEFFKFNQALGWHRAGTLNLNIRYGQMTMALVAQAAIHQMRQRLGEPFSQWDASHLAREIFGLSKAMSVSRTIPSWSPTITPHIETVCANNTRICPTNSNKKASILLYPGSTASNSISVSVNLHAAPILQESNYLPLQNLCYRAISRGGTYPG